MCDHALYSLLHSHCVLFRIEYTQQVQLIYNSLEHPIVRNITATIQDVNELKCKILRIENQFEAIGKHGCNSFCVSKASMSLFDMRILYLSQCIDL